MVTADVNTSPERTMSVTHWFTVMDGRRESPDLG